MNTQFLRLIDVVVRSSVGVVVLTLVVLLPLLSFSPKANSILGAQPQEVGRGDYGSWSYVAVRLEQGLYAYIRYDDSSIQALNAYVQTNRELANQLAASTGEMRIDITFRTPVEIDKFRAWATQAGLRDEQSDLRTVDGDGRIGTVSFNYPRHLQASPHNEPLPQANLNDWLNARKSNRSDIVLQGVFHARGKVDSNRLPLIALDPLVYLADVTPNIVRRDLVAAGVADAEDVVGVYNYDLRHPFWRMDELGLENFSK